MPASVPPRTPRCRRAIGPLCSQVPVDGHVGSSNFVPFPIVRVPLQSLKKRPVGSDDGPMWPMLLKPNVELMFHTARPCRPCFVKIWITPPDASVPYSVVADGP